MLFLFLHVHILQSYWLNTNWWHVEFAVSLFRYIFYFPLLFCFIFISSCKYSFVYIYWKSLWWIGVEIYHSSSCIENLKLSSKLIFYLIWSIDPNFLQIEWFNSKDQFKQFIQFVLNHLPMIYIMQPFNLIKSSFKNLINLPSLHCSSHARQLEEKNL